MSWIGQAAICVEGKCLLDVALEGGVSDAYPGEGFPAYEGDYIASDDPVVSLCGDGWRAWVVESDGVTPG
mgnify:FL=1|jgi:hypothetical protein